MMTLADVVCPPPPPPQSMSEQFLDKGILGVCVLVLAGVIVFLWRRIESQNEKNDALSASRLADRDLRLEDQRANAKVILEMADRTKEALTENTAALRELREELQTPRPRPYR